MDPEAPAPGNSCQIAIEELRDIFEAVELICECWNGRTKGRSILQVRVSAACLSRCCSGSNYQGNEESQSYCQHGRQIWGTE